MDKNSRRKAFAIEIDFYWLIISSDQTFINYFYTWAEREVSEKFSASFES